MKREREICKKMKRNEKRRLVLTGTFRVMAGCLAMGLICSGRPARGQSAEPPEDKVAEKVPVQSVQGEWTFENFDLKHAEVEQNGVRAARVMSRKELPGGPWASGQVGDWVLENAKVLVVVRGRGGPDVESDYTFTTGSIVDFVLRDQMWDLLGGIAQHGLVDGVMKRVVYDSVQIAKSEDPKGVPFLVLNGNVGGNADLPVATKISLDPQEANLTVDTVFGNKSKKNVRMTVLDRVNWGAMPIFVGGYGVPKYAVTTMDLKAHWVCGSLDDFCLGVVKDGPEPIDVAQVRYNRSYFNYGGQTLKPGGRVLSRRTFIATRGDMAPVSEFALVAKKLDYGFLEGVVRQVTDNQPVAGATVEISGFNPFRSRDEPPLPYLITKTDFSGKYRAALPEGGFVATAITPGRRARPIRQLEMTIQKNSVLNFDINQSEVQTFSFEVVDADTDQPIPAKVRFQPLGTTERDRTFSLGPPWRAAGARQVSYLKPGPNQIPISKGQFRCSFSRGPEYEMVERVLTLDPKDPKPIRVQLKRIVPTDGMVAVDFNMATEISPESRVSAEDVVLAAAGEGLEWIFSGDLGRVTDLNRAIRSQGLEKWIRASGGVHLSYQHKRLFGDFYVFPVPLDTPAKTLAALAGPQTSPGDFFGSIRRVFPGAIISVMRPVLANSGYLPYYNSDPNLNQMPTSEDCSLDFDALEVFGSRDANVRKTGIAAVKMFLRNGHYKMPLSASRCESIYHTPPGYPRTYVATGAKEWEKMTDADLAAALRQGKYFITNGPIVDHRIDGKWPTTRLSPAHGEFKQTLRVLSAPWVKTNFVAFQGLSFLTYKMSPGSVVKGAPPYVRFPYDEESAKPMFRKIKKDAAINIEVRGVALDPVVPGSMGASQNVFVYTPPILLDGDGDGKFEMK